MTNRQKDDFAQGLLVLAFAIVISLSAYFAKSGGAAGPVNPPTNAQPNQVEINCQVSYGLGWQASTTMMNYIEPGTTTANYPLSTIVYVPPSTTAQAINLATLFPNIQSAILYAVQDDSNPGQAFSLATGAADTYMPIAAGGFACFRVNCPIASAPTLYVSNSDASNYVILKVLALAN